MIPAATRIVGCDVDYLTCTYGTQADISRLEFFLTRLERKELKRGMFRSAWAMSGYSGFRVGGFEWGTRRDGLIIRLSGETSAEYWKRIGPIASNCSRIDLQTTLVYPEPVCDTISRHFQEVKAWQKKSKRPPQLKLWVGQNGAEAMYSGSRCSSTYLRMYNRFLKSGQKETLGHLRYEVELKAAKALLTLQSLVSKSLPREYIRGYCQAMFSDRGCCLEWGNIAQQRNVCPKRNSDVERRLQWLADGVRPAIQELVARGYRDEVLRALGLTDSK